MNVDLNTLTPTEAGIVKLAAANYMKACNINPATADYIFTRRIIKEARIAGLIPGKQANEGCAPGAACPTPPAPKATPAKVKKNPGVKAPPPPETVGAEKGAKAMKLATAIARALKA